MPMNSVESPVNRLTSNYTDLVTHTPAYKEASVSLRVLPEATGENPLPRTNFRFVIPRPRTALKWNESGNDRIISFRATGWYKFKRSKTVLCARRNYGPAHRF